MAWNTADSSWSCDGIMTWQLADANRWDGNSYNGRGGDAEWSLPWPQTAPAAPASPLGPKMAWNTVASNWSNWSDDGIMTWQLTDANRCDGNSSNGTQYVGSTNYAASSSASGNGRGGDAEWGPAWPQTAPATPSQSSRTESQYEIETDDNDAPEAQRRWTNWSQIAKPEPAWGYWSNIKKRKANKKKGGGKGSGVVKAGKGPPVKGGKGEKGKKKKDDGVIEGDERKKDSFNIDAIERRLKELEPKAEVLQRKMLDVEMDSPEYWDNFLATADKHGKDQCRGCK